MRREKVLAIYKKEVREFLRDKKTLFLMFALPLIIYPLLIMGISSVVLLVDNSYSSAEYSLKVDSSVTDKALIELLNSKNEDFDATFNVIEGQEDIDYGSELSEGTIDAYLAFDNENETYSIYYNSSDTDSNHAAEYLNDRLEDYQSSLTIKKFSEAGLDSKDFLEPIVIAIEDLASNEQSMGQILGMIVPLLLIMGVFIGTMTPAVDVTAGEKERGTQETLMSFPISGHELICGKYLAVSTFGALSALLYLISIGMLGAYMLILMGGAGEMSLQISSFIPSLLVVIVSILAFSLLLGAVIMCICSFAKSTKEASSYVSPIMMVIMLISYAGYLDVHLTVTLSIVPVLNIVLLIKSVLQFEYNALAIILVLVSNIAYAAIAISILGRLYTSEKILFGEHEGSLFNRSSDRKKGSVPTIGNSVLVLAITVVLYLYLGSLLQVKLLIAGVGLTQLILFGVPVFFAWFGRIDYKETFSIAKIKLNQILGIILLAFGSFIVCNLACQPLASFATESMEQYTDVFGLILGNQSFIVTWLIVAIAPAICEEVLFRGYLFSSLKNRLKPWMYIVITALIFGIYHLNLFQGTYAFLLGLVLAYVVYKTGSIFSSMIIHFICNSITVLINKFPEQIGKVLPFFVEETASIASIVVIVLVGIVLMLAGLFIIIKTKKETA